MGRLHETNFDIFAANLTLLMGSLQVFPSLFGRQQCRSIRWRGGEVKFSFLNQTSANCELTKSNCELTKSNCKLELTKSNCELTKSNCEQTKPSPIVNWPSCDDCQVRRYWGLSCLLQSGTAATILPGVASQCDKIKSKEQQSSETKAQSEFGTLVALVDKLPLPSASCFFLVGN